jgi:hypothetical protein
MALTYYNNSVQEKVNPEHLHSFFMQKLFLLALAVASLSACKKDSDTTPSRTDLLTTPRWRITAETETITLTQPGGSPAPTVFDRYAGRTACERDNFHKFNADRTWVIDEGPSKCLANDPQIGSSTWDFNGDQTKLLVPSPSLPANLSEVDIVELTPSTLRLRSDLDGTGTDIIEFTFTAF